MSLRFLHGVILRPELVNLFLFYISNSSFVSIKIYVTLENTKRCRGIFNLELMKLI